MVRQSLNIPAQTGPMFVSVRAANGTAYAMLQNAIRLGIVIEGEGEGQFGAVYSASQGGNAVHRLRAYLVARPSLMAGHSRRGLRSPERSCQAARLFPAPMIDLI